MAEQRKLPLEEDRPRLKLAIESKKEDEQGVSISKTDDTSFDEIDDEQLRVGAHLRLERERQSLSLHDVAEKLRIRAKQLQALEEGDYGSLPGQTFVIGFLRSYATTLGLDAVAVVDLYKSETGAGVRAPNLTFPEPTAEGRMPGVSLMVASVFVALVLFAGWYFYLEDNSIDLEIVQELPERLLEKLTGETEDVALNEAPASSEETPLVVGDTALKPLLLNGEPSQADEVSETVPASEVQDNEAPTETVGVPQDTVSENAVSEDAAPEVTALETAEMAVQSGDVGTAQDAANVTPGDDTPSQILQAPAVEATAPTVEAPKLVEVDEAPVQQPADVNTAAANLPATSEVNPKVEALENETPQNSFEQLTLNTDPASNNIETSSGNEEPIALGMENAEARLVLVAAQESWVQVKADDGTIVLDRIMTMGDTFMLPNRSDLKLSTANASGLAVRLDGKLLGALGNYGEIVRNMSLKPEDLAAKYSTQN